MRAWGAASSRAAREQPLEIALHLPAASLVAAGEGRGIEDDAVEAFPTAGEARENIEDVVGEKPVPVGGEIVQGEVLPAAIERLLRKIDAHGLGSAQGRRDGKRAGVREGIEQLFHAHAPDEGSIRALVNEESRRVTGRKIERKAHPVLLHHRLQG